MTTFERAIEFVLSHEGGYSNDPRDPGGETNFGISKRAFPDVDIKGLTREAAIELYRVNYWEKCRCGDFPPQMGVLLFDTAVNQGPGQAIRILQRAIGVTVDSIIGEQTLAAVKTVPLQSIVTDFVARRALAYAQNENVKVYGLGWFRRLAQCHALSLMQFTQEIT